MKHRSINNTRADVFLLIKQAEYNKLEIICSKVFFFFVENVALTITIVIFLVIVGRIHPRKIRIVVFTVHFSRNTECGGTSVKSERHY